MQYTLLERNSLLLQNFELDGLRADKRQGAEFAQIPQNVLLHNAGRLPDAAAVREGGDDGVGQVEARQRRDRAGTQGGHQRRPGVAQSAGLPRYADFVALWGPEEKAVDRPGTGQQPAGDVLRRTDQRSGQLVLFPVHLSAQVTGEGRPDHHLHDPSTVRSLVRDVRLSVHAGRRTMHLQGTDPRTDPVPVLDEPALPQLSQSGRLR